jgi:hypothetical protein
MLGHPSVYPPTLNPAGAAHAAYGLLVRLLERLEARRLLSDSEIATLVDQVALEFPPTTYAANAAQCLREQLLPHFRKPAPGRAPKIVF